MNPVSGFKATKQKQTFSSYVYLEADVQTSEIKQFITFDIESELEVEHTQFLHLDWKKEGNRPL